MSSQVAGRKSAALNVLYNLTLSGKYHNRFRNQFLAIMFNCSNRSAKIEQLFIRMAT